VFLEWWYVKAQGFLTARVLLVTIPLQLLIAWCIYQLVHINKGNLIVAVAMFSLATVLCRMLVTVGIIGWQAVTTQTWAVFGLLVLVQIIKSWR
jgi:hypothetical protein